MGERNRRERKYGVSYTVLWLLQTESTRKTVRDSQLLTWREKVYLHGLSILCWYWAILKQHEYSSLNILSYLDEINADKNQALKLYIIPYLATFSIKL